MLTRLGRWLAIPACAVALAAQGATPKNTFVIAKDISDIITLDPAEVFELTTGEVIANVYDRLMMFEPENLTELTGGVAESWDVSADGKSITFKIRPGLKFHSGNPVRPEDVEFSLERVVKLNKTPAFIITQFGWNPDNVDDLVQVVDAEHVRVTITEEFSPVLVLNALSAGIASVVDEKLVMSHEKDGDLGYEWLKTNSAGSGAFRITAWKANELVSFEANPAYRHGEPAMKRVILRHVPEPSAQRLLLEKGDIDLARNLTPDQIKGIEGNEDIVVNGHPKGTVVYMAANASHPILGKPEVVQALRYLVDYEGMASSFLAGQFVVHQAFWPGGLWAALEDKPYSYDVEKAKELLAATIALTFVGLTAVTFVIGRVMPVDPVLAIVGDRAPQDVYDRVYLELGLDKPIWQQYLRYLGSLLRGDLGTSIMTGRQVIDDIGRFFPATLELATIATLLGVFVGIPMGVLAAVRQGRWADHVVRVVGLIGYSVPVFWLGLVALLIFYAKLGWTAGPGRLEVFYDGVVDPVTGVLLLDAALAKEWEIFANAASHLILPASILGTYALAYIARMTRSFMLDQLGQEYVLTARVKGVSERAVVWRHAFRNVLVQLITIIGLTYASLLEGSVLTETVFAWPGIGSYITRGLFNNDMNAVLGGTIVVGACFIGINMLSDVLYKVVDPRAR